MGKHPGGDKGNSCHLFLVGPKAVKNYELTVAGPLTTLAPLLEPLFPEGTPLHRGALAPALDAVCRQMAQNCRLCTTISGKNFAKKDWRGKMPWLSFTAQNV